MKKIAVFFTMFLFLNSALYAFAPLYGEISGRVIDSKLNTALPYVNIIIKSVSGDIITGGITDENGYFKITKIKENKVFVSIQYIGYTTLNRELTLDKETRKIDLGTLILEEDNSSLDEVTVIAETTSIQQKVDRKVITIGKDLAASGTASELMIGIPSVNVDTQTGEISLR